MRFAGIILVTVECLCMQIAFATKEVPRKIAKAIEDAETTSKTIDMLHMEQDQLIGDICSHVADNTLMINKLSQTMLQIRELEKYSQYLSCISHFEDLRYSGFSVYYVDP